MTIKEATTEELFNEYVKRRISEIDQGLECKRDCKPRQQHYFLQFTDAEIQNFPPKFRQSFVRNGQVALVHKYRKDRALCCEIYYKADDFDVSVTASNAADGKQQFIKKVLAEVIQTPLKKRNNSRRM